MISNNITWILVLGYLVLSILVGNIAGRKEKNASNYFHSSLPSIVIAFACTGTAISGVMFIGTPGTTTIQGVGIWLAATTGGLLGVVLCNLVLGKPLSRLNKKFQTTTIPDMLVLIFHAPELRHIAIPCILILSIVFAACQWQSIGTLLNTLTGLDYTQATILGVIVVALYSVLGGNKSTSVVATVQVAIAMAACLYLVACALQVSGGSMTGLCRQVADVDPSLLRMTNTNLSLTAIISYVLMYGIGTLGQPAIVCKYFQIKEARLLPNTLLLGVISMVCTSLVPIVSLVMIIKIHAREIPPLAYSDACVPTFIATYCGPVAGGLLISACLAAIMSTGAALIVSAGSTLVKDIMMDWMHIDCNGRKGIIYSRVGMITVILLSVIIALFPTGGILQIGFAAFATFGAVFAPVIVLGLRWRRCTKQGAFFGMLSSFLLVSVITVLDIFDIWNWPFDLHISVVAMGVNIVLLILVSLSTPKQEKNFMPCV